MKKTGFYAYPSLEASPSPGLINTLRRAIDFINHSGYEIEVTGWETVSGSGQQVIHKIIDAINDADVFLCDLTFTNPNVLFELGYAIISDKPVWISVDQSIHDEEKFRNELNLLTTIEHRVYTNADELGARFLSDAPFDNLENTLYKKQIEPILHSNFGKPSLLYLKSPVPTDASNDLTRQVKLSHRSLVTDDPQEVSRRSFDWYLEKIYQSVGVIAHFLDDIRARRFPQNAKYAFICGMAYGAGKPLLMLAESPYKAPIDFRDLMVECKTPEQCVDALNYWLDREVQEAYSRRSKQYQNQRKKFSRSNIQNINLGEYVAEDEEQTLSDYFITTSAYEEARKASSYSLFIGRRGTGKTANLYKIAEDLRSRPGKDYLVCVIKPRDIQVEDIFGLFRISLSKADQSYLVEALWKFLVLTEIALNVYDSIQEKHPDIWDKDERNFCAYVDSHGDLIKSDFDVRMERAIEDVCGMDTSIIGSVQKGNISKILHEELLARLRVDIGKALGVKKKVVVLIDNLDKAWEKRHDLPALAQFLFGLLNVGQTITAQFQKQSSLLQPIDLKLIVFLRSDIFSVLAPLAREHDRLKYTYINWNDPRMLELVIEERFARSLNNASISEEIWDIFFCDSIQGMHPRKYLVEHVIPRPRDIIYFCKQARANAINHQHSRIEVIDLELAEKEYSKYCLASVLDEMEVIFEHIEDLLIAFAGSPEIVTREMILEYMEYALIPKSKLKTAIELLCDVTFLGLEASPDKFEFIYDEMQRKILFSRAQKTAKTTGVTRYAINLPFHSVLGITKQSNGTNS